jgi:hypothetical protein
LILFWIGLMGFGKVWSVLNRFDPFWIGLIHFGIDFESLTPSRLWGEREEKERGQNKRHRFFLFLKKNRPKASLAMPRRVCWVQN